jgi:hypothetical protein
MVKRNCGLDVLSCLMLDSGAYNLRRATGRPLVRHTRAKLTPTALPLASREDLLGSPELV